jgi:hypothetical protein
VSPEQSHSRWPGRVAVGIVRGDPPEVFLAEDEFVLSRVLALKVVAASPPEDFDHDTLERIRSALLAERWADAVGEWIGAGGDAIDGYPDEIIWTDGQLDEEVATMEIRVARIFGGS